MTDDLVRPLALMKRSRDLLLQLERNLAAMKATYTKLPKDSAAALLQHREIERTHRLILEVRRECGDAAA